MGRKRKATGSGPDFDTHTEACPKMTRRWRRDRIPEIATWLLVIRRRIERAREAAIRAAKNYPQVDGTKAVSGLTHRLVLVNELMNGLWDKWSDVEWWTETHIIGELIRTFAGIVPPSGWAEAIEDVTSRCRVED